MVLSMVINNYLLNNYYDFFFCSKSWHHLRFKRLKGLPGMVVEANFFDEWIGMST